MQEEFGDVLLQAVFHVSIEEDAGRFTMEDVVDGVCKKLIFRHPHLFAGVKTEDWDWEKMKQQEKGETTQTEVLNAVARSLPALIRAEKLSSKSAKAGVRWDSAEEALTYAAQQLQEGGKDAIGAALFAITGACKLQEIDPEQALHDACESFIARFAAEEEKGAEHSAIRQFLP